MARLTKWDAVRGCYVIAPDATGNHIQKLGKYEDRDTANRIERTTNDGEYEYECGECGTIVFYNDVFCAMCGQRLKEVYTKKEGEE